MPRRAAGPARVPPRRWRPRRWAAAGGAVRAPARGARLPALSRRARRPLAGAAGRRRRRRRDRAAAGRAGARGVAGRDQGRRPLSDFDRLTLHQAVTIVALELLRGRVAGDTERRLAGDVLAALVEGELTGAELVRRLEPFGLGDTVAAIVVAAPRRVAAVARAGRGRAGAGAARGGGPGLVASEGPLTCALVAGMEEEELFALAERVARRLRGTGWRAGRASASGAPVAGGDARRSFHEARCAVEALALGVVGEPVERRGAATGAARPAPPTRTSARSSCCCRCRTTRRCGCSVTRSSGPSRPAKDTTEVN